MQQSPRTAPATSRRSQGSVHSRCRLLILAALAAACLAPAPAGAVTEEDIYDLLRTHRIPFFSHRTRSAAVNAILGTVDPRARFVSCEDTTADTETVAAVETWAEGLCYIKLNGLFPGGGAEVAGQMQAWAQAAKSGLVLDLRGAGGADLASADVLAGLWIEGGTVLYALVDGRGHAAEVRRVPRCEYPFPQVPAMLLIDGDTRDAAELLACLLEGRPGVMLVGSHTMGDVGVRQRVPVAGADCLYIATRWIVPADRPTYDYTGVPPDILVDGAQGPAPEVPAAEEDDGKPLSEKARLDRELMERVRGDAALARATDILLGLKALGVYANAVESSTNAAGPEGP